MTRVAPSGKGLKPADSIRVMYPSPAGVTVAGCGADECGRNWSHSTGASNSSNIAASTGTGMVTRADQMRRHSDGWCTGR